MNKFLKTALFSALLIGGATEVQSVVNWRFQLGGMATMLRYKREHVSTSQSFTLMLGSEIQFPLKEKWFIETGLDFRFGPTTYTYLGSEIDMLPLKDFNKHGEYIGDEYKYSARISTNTAGFVEIPIRAGYKLKLNDENEFQFSFGPYMSFLTQKPEQNQNCFALGLSPSVVFKHRALSLGLYYQNPCLYNGIKNRETNTLMFTIGVNFNGRKINVDKLIAGLEVANSVLTVANNSLATYYGNGDSADSSASYSDESSTGSNGSTTGSSYSSPSKTNSAVTDHSTSDIVHRNIDRNTYYKDADLVRAILNGEDTVNKKSDIQRRMRKTREKWAKRNMGWDASPYETK
ncbi:MAG: hypothetical protein K2N05_04365 [Muribaculaceae bacterium]|nr:hypothetical protein [Muribaculaceae bacterium]